jgi:glycyl-tRNA synthetase beta chain
VNGLETKPLLVEIGCEEIPARFLAAAQEEFGRKLRSALVEARLADSNSEIATYSTPRRLVANMRAVFGRQEDIEETIIGPSLKAAYDASGLPTRAAQNFAAKNGQTVESLIRVTTPKGEYVALRKLIAGRSAEDLLDNLLPQVIQSLEFPKSMVWPGKNGMRFVRPIRWILVVFGKSSSDQGLSSRLHARLAKTFPGTGIVVGHETRGHRSLGSKQPLAVQDFADYAKKLRENFVEFDPQARREWVQLSVKAALEGTLLEALAAAKKAVRPGILAGTEERLENLREASEALPEDLRFRAVEDHDLEDWLVNSTEWPRAILGAFDQRFLALPREILITVMRDHQHYFAVEDRAGNLAPHFVAVLNMKGDPKGLVRHGHERVLTARFSDAEFFWQADQKIPFGDRLPMLDRVTYQKDLGTYGDKVRRMKMIAAEVCQLLEQRGRVTSQEAGYALRAVELSKCDLTTQMVQEFPELQGIIGGLYAAAQGEPQAVADAIYDHYLPQGIEGTCPRGMVGAVVSIVDKLDTIVAGFAAGLEPTGSSDPFGLRRAGNGIVKVSVEVLPGLNLLHLINLIKAIDFGVLASPDLCGRIAKFMRERVEYYLATVPGLRYDTIRAIVQGLGEGRGWSVPSEALRLGQALERVRDREEFLSLAQAARRTRNILHKSATFEDFGSGSEVDEGLLSAGPERELYDAYRTMKKELDAMQDQNNYENAFLTLGRLRPYVDNFFESVLVMDSDQHVRSNRLRLLSELNTLVFTSLADLAEIVSAGESRNVDAPTSKAHPEKD